IPISTTHSIYIFNLSLHDALPILASGIFAVLDDIAALMDDVAVTAKLATRKTAGILGDDLAVNAEKATGFLSSREIPVLIAIMRSEEHTSELQSRENIVCRLLLEK